MKKFLLAFLILLSLSTLTVQANTEPGLINTYRARLSRKDHLDSHGNTLGTVAAIIRQDRVYYHLVHQPDGEDDDDRYFDTPQHRDRLEELVEHASISRETRHAILCGTPLVRVKIYREGDEFYLSIVLLEA